MLIVGQGLAGTLLGWSLERAGRSFAVADQGHEASASRVGAGLVNPVTGERWAHPAGWAEKADAAWQTYREIETTWGISIVSTLRIRREWQHEAEEARVRENALNGALAPWVRSEGLDATGAWIEGAWRVDLPTLIAAARARWRALGQLHEIAFAAGDSWPGPVIWCIGAAETRLPELRAVGGETLALEIEAAALRGAPAITRPSWRSDTVRHDGFWVLPVGEGVAWAGATFVRDEKEREPRREALRRSVRQQLSDLSWREKAILGGWRMTSPDRTPRSAWLPGREGREGVFNGLGSKGVLLAPALASAWAKRV